MEDNKKIQQLKMLSTLALITAILFILGAVPFLAYFVNIISFGALCLIPLGLSIAILVYAVKTGQSKVSSILGVITSALAFITSFVQSCYLYFTGLGQYADMYSPEMVAEIIISEYGGFLIAFSLGFICWFLHIVTIIFLFISSSSAKKQRRILEIESFENQTVYSSVIPQQQTIISADTLGDKGEEYE